MCSSAVLEGQKQWAANITTFLTKYHYICDSYIIEFFSEDLWDTLPTRWQQVLADLTPKQIADLLLDRTCDRRYPSVWPLSLLAFRATAHALAFPRVVRQEQSREVGIPEEFLENQCQSSLLGHIFRKHVKPKKQHEIQKLGTLVKQLCDQTECKNVVDVGSGQGHLTRFLSFGLGLNVTAIEADQTLVDMAFKFDGQLLSDLEKEKRKKKGSSQVPVPGPCPRHVAGWVNPKASWETFIEQLSNTERVSEESAVCGNAKKRLRDSEQKLVSTTESESHDCKNTPFNTVKPSSDWHSSDSHLSPECQSSAPALSKRLCKKEDIGESSRGSYNPCAPPVYELGVPGGVEVAQRNAEFILTGLHACGDLSATLLRHFVDCPYVRAITSVACCYMKITTKEHPSPPGLVAPPLQPVFTNEMSCSEFGYPMSSWVRGLQGHELSYKAREGACHAMEDYIQRLREESALLKTHCYRATLETIIRGARPELRRAGVQTVKKSHLLSFPEYARLGLPRVGLPADTSLDPDSVKSMLRQERRVVVYFSLALLLAPVVETLVLLDRMIYLQENGIQSHLLPLFDPDFSPRNLVLVAVKPSMDVGGTIPLSPDFC